jgi:tetrahydromethanopterin S-methyltransferase subunit A
LRTDPPIELGASWAINSFEKINKECVRKLQAKNIELTKKHEETEDNGHIEQQTKIIPHKTHR